MIVKKLSKAQRDRAWLMHRQRRARLLAVIDEAPPADPATAAQAAEPRQ